MPPWRAVPAIRGRAMAGISVHVCGSDYHQRPRERPWPGQLSETKMSKGCAELAPPLSDCSTPRERRAGSAPLPGNTMALVDCHPQMVKAQVSQPEGVRVSELAPEPSPRRYFGEWAPHLDWAAPLCSEDTGEREQASRA